MQPHPPRRNPPARTPLPRPLVHLAPAALALAAGLACGGLGSPAPEVQADDPVAMALAARNLPLAEQLLEQRLGQDPRDAVAARLLGDLNLYRAQDYPDTWKDNVVRARNAWKRAVKLDPARCGSWRRLALGLVLTQGSEELAVDPAELQDLPLGAGWKSCPEASLLVIEEVRSAQEPAEQTASARPWVPDAWRSLDRGDFKPFHPVVPPEQGQPFVVLNGSRAEGEGGASGRDLDHGEIVPIESLQGDSLRWRDRRAVATKPGRATVLAAACPNTRWDLSADDLPVGYCQAGQADLAKSPLYDPARLRPAGAGYFEVGGTRTARLDPTGILLDSVTCEHAPVGPRLGPDATCPVAYRVPIPVWRSAPLAAGRAAEDEVQAANLQRAARRGPLWGDEVARSLARGELPATVPWSWAFLAANQEALCKPRGLVARAELLGDHVRVSCTAGDRTWVFDDHLAPRPTAPG